MQAEVAANIRKVFNAINRPTADSYLKQIVQKYAHSTSRLANWMETNLPEGLTIVRICRVPSQEVAHQHTLERLNHKIGGAPMLLVSFLPKLLACVRVERYPNRTRMANRQSLSLV